MFEFFITSVIQPKSNRKKIDCNPGCVPAILIKISSFYFFFKIPPVAIFQFKTNNLSCMA